MEIRIKKKNNNTWKSVIENVKEKKICRVIIIIKIISVISTFNLAF